MHISPVIKKLTDWTSMNSLTKCICLMFFLFATVAYPNQTLAADTSSKQSKQIGGNETISGAFGIKLGENIKPYVKGIDPIFGISLIGKTVKYKILKPPVNLKEIFPDVYNLELLGISDDNDRVIILRFMGTQGVGSCDTNTAKAINEVLREKYKITKPQPKSWELLEEYGDSEGNGIRMSCKEGYLDVTYISHLMADYIARLEAAQQKQKEDIKKSLDKGI